MALKGSLYALPYSSDALEDFEWLRHEIAAVKGQASVFEAASVDGVEDAHIIEQFRQARARDYKALLKQLKAAQTRATKAGNRKIVDRRGDDSEKALRQLADRLTRLKQIDFFSAHGRDAADSEFAALERLVRPPSQATSSRADDPIDPVEFQHRVWITRPRPGIDRIASAWLITRFIDRDARFAFADEATAAPDAVPFDMYSSGFGHEGGRCTFEVLHTRFGINDNAVRRLGEIVHDLDLKDDRYRAPQAAGIAALVEGLQRKFTDDAELLMRGIEVFDAVHGGLQSPLARPSRVSRLRSPRVGESS